MLNTILAFIFLMSPQLFAATPGVQKIVNGAPLTSDHPGAFNTVALIKDDHKIFCTGSLVSENIVLTAKHCLVDKELKDVNIFFGESTNHISEGVIVPASEFEVKYPHDWEMVFPSFDVAWVKFDGGIPDGYSALPILSSNDRLISGTEIHQVGFGNHSSRRGEILAGDKLFGKTIFKEYINGPRFFHILLFDGEEGQGSCHGDSGGPAYVKLDNQWFIIGVTNGFDVVLTPDTMVRTSDPDFPYNVDCSKNQSLYSFAGAHGRWIEETSQTTILKSAPFIDIDKSEEELHQSLKEWCESTDFGSPSWNMLKYLLDQRVDEIPQEDGEDFYNNCEKIVSYLEGLDEITINLDETPEVDLNFTQLRLLPSLKALTINSFPLDKIDLTTLTHLNLERLDLIDLGLSEIDLGDTNTIVSLGLDRNPIADLANLKKIKGLQSLSLSGAVIDDVSQLSSIPLKSLSLVGINSPALKGLKEINKSLEVLDIRDTYLDSASALCDLSNLKELKISDQPTPLDLTTNQNLEVVYLNGTSASSIKFADTLGKLKELSFVNSDLEDLSFLATANNIEKLTLTYNKIQNLSVFESNDFPKLKELNLSVNPILNVTPLKNLKGLNFLRLFRTPLATGLVPKTEENCPVIGASPTLGRFCSN